MTRAISTKRALFTSIMAMVLCFVMMLGTTFAWFTDSASSTGNKIVAGNLDVELLMYDGSQYVNISKNADPIFGAENSLLAQNENLNTLWEPGKTQVAYLAIQNNGSLDLKYTVALDVMNDEGDLYKAMQYTITPDAKDGAAVAWDAANAKSVAAQRQSVSDVVTLGQGETHYFALSIHMKSEAGNEYQGGKISFDLSVFATQVASEEDSFGNTYDDGIELMVAPVTLDSTTPLTTIPGGESIFDNDTPNALLIADKIVDTDSVLLVTEQTVATVFFDNVKGAVRDDFIANEAQNTIVLSDCDVTIPTGKYLVNNQSGDTTMQVIVSNVTINGEFIDSVAELAPYLNNVANPMVYNQ